MPVQPTTRRLLGALLTALCFLLGSVDQVFAHAGHDHGPAVQAVKLTALEFANTEKANSDYRFSSFEAVSDKAAPLLHEGDCCCGSAACNTGVAASYMSLVQPYGFVERLTLPPAAGLAQAELSGIDRPPRSGSQF